ncbi:MAG: hypothetical protein ACLQU3_34710 [Limisphaerales bacterium]
MQIRRQLQAVLVSEAFLLLATINSGSVAYAATGSPPPATQAQYRFTTIDILDQVAMLPFAPNAEGVTCGYYFDSEGDVHGFLWRNGRVTPLDPPGWVDTGPCAINDLGVVSGVYSDGQELSYAFLYRISDGTWTQLPTMPGTPLQSNTVLNNKGTVVGSASQGDWVDTYDAVGWIWDGKSYSFFTVPEASESGIGTNPLGINDPGQVVGYYADDVGTIHGFLKDHKSITTLDVPGADLTESWGINDGGDIVGLYYVFSPSFVEEGFILHDGHFLTFEVPGNNGGLTGINNQGVLSGYYVDSNGIWHGFIATPEGCGDTR